MTQAEFIFQLEELRRRVLPVYYGGGAMVFLFNLTVILYVFHFYPPQIRNQDSLIAYSVVFVACLSVLVGFYIVLRKTISRYAPICSACGAKATWKERSKILTTCRCQKCQSVFILGE
jgi:hypothetical protein